MSPERPADPDFAADIGDAYVTLCVHAGIAAADTLCAHHLRRYNSGDNHKAGALLVGEKTMCRYR